MCANLIRAIFLVFGSLGLSAADRGSELIVVDVPGSKNADIYVLNNHDEGVGTSYSTASEFQVFYWSLSAGAKILGTHTHRTGSQAPKINESGMVALSAGVAGWEHAFRWSLKEGFLDLGNLGGDPQGSYGGDAWTNAINNRGEVVGYSPTHEGNNHAFVWRSDSGLKDLGTLGGWQSWALDINDRSQVVGVSMLSNGLSHGFVWSERSGMRDLGVPAGFEYSQSLKINSQGEVVGTVSQGLYTTFAFFFSEQDGMTVLNPPGSSGSYPEGLNDRAEVLINTWFGTIYRAFLWSKKSGYMDLGTLGGLYSYGSSLNRQGEVVGGSSTSVDLGGTGFVWSQRNGMRSIELGGMVGSANFINDKGDIVGYVDTATGQKPFVKLR
jgi:probable HAF family extracellular repeat protein